MQVPMISPSASASELSNKSVYPYFMRLIPSDVQQVSLKYASLDYD
jgi:hypothetical protein